MSLLATSKIFHYDDNQIFVNCVGVQRNLLSSSAMTTSTLFIHRISYYDSMLCIMDRKRVHRYQTTDKYKRALKWKEYFED